MKKCNSCEVEKGEYCFGRRAASKDGLSAKCKTCQRVYDKARSKDKSREEARRIYAQTDEGKLATNKAKAEYRKRNPRKSKAHAVVSRVIKNGNLIRKPCETCRREPAHAHHDDYAEPLNIRWLCVYHHKRWHDKNGEGKNPF